MIERIDLFHLPFYKKEAFTGSDRGVRFWIGQARIPKDGQEEEETVLRTIVWPEPFALQATPDEQKTERDFPFTEEGLDEAFAWITGEGRNCVQNVSSGT